MFLTRFFGLSSKSSRSAAPAQFARWKSRLGCEMLEARDVPATLIWSPVIGGDYLAGTPQNWLPGGVTVENRWSLPLTSADDLVFNGYGSFFYNNEVPGDPQANCVITSSEPSQFNGIHLVNSFFGGYTGTVHLQKSITVGDLELKAEYAAVAQDGSTSDNTLTITRTLNWTGGTLNSATTAGTVKLVGATGLIDPGDGKTVNTRSTLSLESATDISIGYGGIHFNGDTGIINGAGCFLTQLLPPVVANPQAPVPKLVISKNEMSGGYINNSGTAVFHYLTSDGGLRVNAGVVVINNDSTPGSLQPKGDVEFNGQAKTVNAGEGGPRSVLVNGGMLQIENGATLTAILGVIQFDGALNTTPTGLVESAEVATIKGGLEVFGGEVWVSGAAEGHKYGTLLVDGVVTFSGGTYRPFLKSGDTTKADMWKSTKKFTVTAQATIAPRPVAGNSVGSAWKVVSSDVEVVGPDPSVAGDWEITKSGDPVKSLNVQGK